MTTNGPLPVCPPPPPRVAVLLSQRLAHVGAGLDLLGLRGWLQATWSDVHADLIPDPVRHPADIRRTLVASGATRLVLGLAPGEYAPGAVQVQARQAGIDPLGVAALDLGAQASLLGGPSLAMERAKLLLAAAVAKVRAFPGSGPEHLKAALAVAVSRRALFTLTAHEYHTVPAVRSEHCIADRGCRHCAAVCPQDAVHLRGERVELSKARCEGCGLCVSACPTEALEYPGHSFAELEAQLTALLDPALADLWPRGVVFACRRAAAALDARVARGFRYPAGWLLAGVPCVGMLSPAWFLRCLALGAAGVGLVGCDGQCPFGQDSIVAERVVFCQDLLRLLGAVPHRVKRCALESAEPTTWALPTALEPPIAASALAGPPTDRWRTGAAAIRALACAHGAPNNVTLAHPRSPLGSIELDPRGCTACAACAAACPTGALTSTREAHGVAISFDTALCDACGLCVPRCPEGERGVLRLQRVVDLRQLAAGRQVLYRDSTPRCAACGAPVAPAAMLARLAEMLGDEYRALAGTISRYCVDCRGLATPRAGEGDDAVADPPVESRPASRVGTCREIDR